MTTKLKINDPREILALVPFQLGFTPEESVVVISLRGTNKRVGLVARVDSEGLTGATGKTLAHQLLAHCIKDGAASLVVIGYTSNRHNPTSLQETIKALKAFERENSAHLPIDELLIVTESEFGHFAEREKCLRKTTPRKSDGVETLCVEHRQPLQALETSKVAAHMVFEGKTTFTNRAELGVIQPANTDQQILAQKAYLDEVNNHQAEGYQNVTWRNQTFRKVLDIFEADPLKDVTSDQYGVIARALEDITLRDAFLIYATSNGRTGAEDFLTAASSKPAKRDVMDKLARNAIAEITDASQAKKPSEHKTMRIVNVLVQTISHLPKPQQHVAPRTLLALIAWWTGSGSLASRHLEESQAIKHDYGLAELVQTALTHGLAPGWQRQVK